MRFSIELPQSVVKAAAVEGLRGRAHARGIVDYACECGHGKMARRFIWHLHCGQGVAEFLVDELDRQSVTAETLTVRGECARVAAILRDAIGRPPEPGEFLTRIVYTVTKPPRAIDRGIPAAAEHIALPVDMPKSERSENDPFRFTFTRRVVVGDMQFRVARLTIGDGEKRALRWALIDQNDRRYRGPRAPTPLDQAELERLIRHWWMLRTATIIRSPASEASPT